MLFSLLKHYFELALTVSRSFTVSPLLYLMVLKTVSPGCGVRASVMLFFSLSHLCSRDSAFRHRNCKSVLSRANKFGFWVYVGIFNLSCVLHGQMISPAFVPHLVELFEYCSEYGPFCATMHCHVTIEIVRKMVYCLFVMVC